jgi:hypothetical protein
MPKKSKQGQAAKIKWVIKNYFDKGKSRPEAVKGLMTQYGITYNYARTLIYNHLCYLDWKRAPYPENRKARKKTEATKESLKEKFKPIIESDSELSTENGEMPDDFEF